jgi:hypothetical protein
MSAVVVSLILQEPSEECANGKERITHTTSYLITTISHFLIIIMVLAKIEENDETLATDSNII